MSAANNDTENIDKYEAKSGSIFAIYPVVSGSNMYKAPRVLISMLNDDLV